MKKILLTLLISCLWSFAFSQKKSKDPVKVILPLKDNQIYFEFILDSLNGATKDDLYNISLRWLAESFNDSKEVIQIKDKELGSIVGTGAADYTTKGFLGSTQRMSFIVDIAARENKVRLRLYQFKYKTFGASGYGGASSTTDSEYFAMDPQYIAYLNEKVFPKERKGYYEVVKNRIESIISSFEKHIKLNIVKDNF